jgi:hypothetical protein
MNDKIKQLLTREKPIAWDVLLNGIQIGTISDTEYACIRSLVYRQYKYVIALDQFFNLIHVFVAILRHLGIMLPLTVFWSGLGLALIDPEQFTEIWYGLQQNPDAFLVILKAFLALLLVSIMLMAAFGFRFGFRNYYIEAIDNMLRRHFNMPAKGKIDMIPKYRTRLAVVAGGLSKQQDC